MLESGYWILALDVWCSAFLNSILCPLATLRFAAFRLRARLRRDGVKRCRSTGSGPERKPKGIVKPLNRSDHLCPLPLPLSSLLRANSDFLPLSPSSSTIHLSPVIPPCSRLRAPSS